MGLSLGLETLLCVLLELVALLELRGLLIEDWLGLRLGLIDRRTGLLGCLGCDCLDSCLGWCHRSLRNKRLLLNKSWLTLEILSKLIELRAELVLVSVCIGNKRLYNLRLGCSELRELRRG